MAFHFYDELNEVTAVDVEIRVNAAGGQNLYRCILSCHLKKFFENGRIEGHSAKLERKMSGFHP